MSYAFSVCLFVCPHDKTKTAETTTTKLATGIVHTSFCAPINIRSRVRVRYSQRELCILSSAQPLVNFAVNFYSEMDL